MNEIIQLDYINGAVSHVEQTTNSYVITVDLGTEQKDPHMTGLAYCKLCYSSDCSAVSEGLYEKDLGAVTTVPSASVRKKLQYLKIICLLQKEKKHSSSLFLNKEVLKNPLL